MPDDRDQQRKSKPKRLAIDSDPRRIARREAENGLRQFDLVIETVERALASGERFKLRPSFLQSLNRIAVEDISELPGVFRPGQMTITNSRHQPPTADRIPVLVEELCDYVSENWDRGALHLAAYAMWRVNWIHPFEDGNGRTSRAVAYAILCIRLGYKLPGTKTIPDHIAANKLPYYEALEAANAAAESDRTDVSAMESLLGDLLAEQLYDFHREVIGKSE